MLPIYYMDKKKFINGVLKLDSLRNNDDFEVVEPIEDSLYIQLYLMTLLK